MRDLRLYLLGPFQAMLAGQPVQGFAYDKVRALLAFLAIEHHSAHSREILGTLLWPEANASTARTNLRKALSTLRKALADEDSSPFLIIQRDTVQFNPECNFWLDVDQLKSRLDRTVNHTELQFETCIADLEEAAALYRGGFLHGLMVNSLEFEEWMLTLRENLHTQVLSALHELTQYYLRQGEYNLAQKHALRQVELEPYREEARRALMLALSRSGQRSAALSQYERCRAILAEELGVEPSHETQMLYQRILSAGEARPHNLPGQFQRLVGRQTEQFEINRMLANPDCRMLTLVGIGGIGKTSLARQTAQQQLENFLHGVFWVSLASLNQPSQILPAIFDAFSVSLSSDPEAQLLDYLREKSILLIFDNFEHLFSQDCDTSGEALRLLNTLLNETRHVKLLITSRERLCLQAEWVYPVEGLPFPADIASEDADTWSQYAAVQLFMHRARQVAPGFLAQTNEHFQIARICKLVNGIPLGIELAAGWVSQLTCQAIAESINCNLDFLVTSQRDRPSRHQSLRAIFEHSWKLLSADERAVARKISVFQTAFSRVAAREMAQATPHWLAALVNKSFLRLNVDGEYSLHSLLKGFLAQELATDPDEQQRTRRSHALYYARFLKEREYALTVQYQAAALDEVGSKIGDVHAAWDWAITQKDVEILSGSLEGICIYYWARNQFSEGQANCQSALQAIESLAESPEKQLLLARLQARIADFIYWLGDLETADQWLQESIVRLQKLDAPQELVYALELSSRVALWQGEYEKAEKAAAAVIDLTRRSGPAHTLAQALNILANIVCESNCDFETANALYMESLTLYRKLENPFGIAKVLINQGALYHDQGNLIQAQQRYRESLKLYREINYVYGISVCLNNLAIVARTLGEFEQAKDLIEESLTLKRETGNRVAILHSLLEIGALNTTLGNYAQARSHYCEAMRMAQAVQASGIVFHIVLGFAELYAQMGETLQATELATWVLVQQEAGQDVRSKAETFTAGLVEKIDAAELEQCQELARQINPDELIQALIES